MSLRGLVLPIGGLKEKLIAAHQNGIQRVLIPHRSDTRPLQYTGRAVEVDIAARLKPPAPGLSRLTHY